MLYRRDAIVVLLLLAALFLTPAQAQDYPSRTVEIVVPFAAGGGTDLIARVLVERLSETLRQRFVIINRPGASTNIGTAAVANAPAGRLHAAAHQHLVCRQPVALPQALVSTQQRLRPDRR